MAIMNMKKKGSGPIAKSDTDQLIYALDVGSSYIRLVSGFVTADKQIKIQGMVSQRSIGIMNGNISNIDALARNIAVVIQDFQNKYNVTIDRLVTVVSGKYVAAENLKGTTTVQTGTVTIADRNKAIMSAITGLQKIVEPTYTIIHMIPHQYSTESSDFVVNPLNMYAKRLDVNVHIIGCKSMYKMNIEQAIKMTNPDLVMSNLIYAGNAAASAVVTESEKEIGVICIDIGGGTVNSTLFEGTRQLYSFGIEDGGNYITNEIAKAFSISKEIAENLKCKYGIADPRLIRPEHYETKLTIPIASYNSPNGEGEIQINYVDLANVIHNAVVNMCSIIFQTIVRYVKHEFDRLELGGGVVLTGGTSKLEGIANVFSDFIAEQLSQEINFKCSAKVRIGHPIGTSIIDGAGDPKELSDSDKAVAIGLLRSARFEDVNQYKGESHDNVSEASTGIIGKIQAWFKREL